MAEAGFDALVCLSPENVAYTAGVVVPSQQLMRWRHAATVISARGQEAMVCVDMEETAVRQALPDMELRTWEEFGGSAMETVAGVLQEFGVGRGRVALEMGYISVRDYGELQGLLTTAEFGDAGPILVECRKHKSPAELELLGRLSRIADAAIAASCREVKAGSTEMDLAAALTRAVYENGAQQFKLMIVATGERSQLPNVGPSSRVLEPGDICRLEIFPVIDGYHAGVCRTAIVGAPPPHARRVYRNLVECRRAVLEALRPGARADKVYELFHAKFDELGMPSIAFVGHGIGLDLHEPPYLAAFDETTLDRGMVLGVEPLVYRTGHGFGMQIKDMVAVEEGGCRLLSDLTPTEQPLQIEA
jgi:Xaa-Pro dipeptidase